jgi:hypothetical protein
MARMTCPHVRSLEDLGYLSATCKSLGIGVGLACVLGCVWVCAAVVWVNTWVQILELVLKDLSKKNHGWGWTAYSFRRWEKKYTALGLLMGRVILWLHAAVPCFHLSRSLAPCTALLPCTAQCTWAVPCAFRSPNSAAATQQPPGCCCLSSARSRSRSRVAWVPVCVHGAAVKVAHVTWPEYRTRPTAFNFGVYLKKTPNLDQTIMYQWKLWNIS